ncbi:HAMP domain-containing protein [Mesorhizobium sp. M0808]|uniref:HAMP domain-containing protein n=1 Tax=Mesorhizobium sp. M0808 TaxID=2957002 RepID=UPI00333C9425
MTFSASWTNPNNITNRLVGWVARLPARVQTKLLIAFLSIVGLLIVLGAVGLQVLSGINDQTNELIKLQRRIAAYRQVQHDTTNQLYSISTALLLQDDRMLDAALRQLSQFGYDLDRMEFVAESEAAVLGQVRQEYDRFTAGVTQVVELIRAGRTDEARKVQQTEIMPLAERLERLTNQLVNIAEADMVTAIETTKGAYGTSRLIVVSFAVGSILLALALGYIISWSLIEPVKKIETRLRQIAAGDFAQQVAVVNRDELGVLAGNVNQTSEQLGRLYQEVQARTAELARSVGELEALGEVSKAVNSTLDLDTVLQTIVAKAVQLSDTDAGTIYVFSSTRQQFRSRATYGWAMSSLPRFPTRPSG